MSYLSRSMRENSGPRTASRRAELLSSLSDADRAALAGLRRDVNRRIVNALMNALPDIERETVGDIESWQPTGIRNNGRPWVQNALTPIEVTDFRGCAG